MPVSLPASRTPPTTATATATATAGTSAALSAVPPATPVPSVIVTLSGATSAPEPAVYSAQPVKPAPVWQDASVALETASGRALTLTLQDDGSFNVKADGDAPLSDVESAAIAKLTAAFKSVLDGMGSAPPRLDLGSLAQLDTSVLSSIHVSAHAAGTDQPIQTIDFTADATSRAVTIDGSAGKIDVSVDLSSPAITGSKAQQATAMAGYLKQIDQAAARGHADPAFVALFKDAFTQINSPPGADAAATTRSASWLTDTDHALMSGLADFNASITLTARASNPYRPDEHDAFSYQVSQSTQVSGRSASERGITQTSSSQLRASFHSALSADARLNLTGDPKSQNYYYTQIADSAQSNASISYRKGLIVQALSSRTVSQNTEQSKYVMGKQVEDLKVPLKRSQQRDLLPVLTQMETHPARTKAEHDERARALTGIHDSLGLQTDPAALD